MFPQCCFVSRALVLLNCIFFFKSFSLFTVVNTFSSCTGLLQFTLCSFYHLELLMFFLFPTDIPPSVPHIHALASLVLVAFINVVVTHVDPDCQAIFSLFPPSSVPFFYPFFSSLRWVLFWRRSPFVKALGWLVSPVHANVALWSSFSVGCIFI